MVESERLSHHSPSVANASDVRQHEHFWMDTNRTVSNNNDETKVIFSQIPNELIFDQILIYFEYKWILQTARLVCKMWNDQHKTIKTNQFKIKYHGNIENISFLMNEHSDEVHQVTELIIHATNDSNVELERQFISKLINLQNLDLSRKYCDISIIKEFVRLKNLKRIRLCNPEHFEEFIHCPSNIKSISVSNCVIRDVDFSNLSWPLEEFSFDYLTSKSIMSLLKNEIINKNLNKLEVNDSILDENVMKEISTLSKLRELDLDSVECGDVGYEYISKLENLESLSLFGYNNVTINGSGISNFRNLTNITRLTLTNNCIDNEGANYLSSLTSLKYLYLENNNISDEGLKNYSKLTNLSELFLENNEIGSIGANYLSQITNITFLDLEKNLNGHGSVYKFYKNCFCNLKI